MPNTLEQLDNPRGNVKWLEAKLYVRPQCVDREHGSILGCSIVSAGPALGHGVSLDAEFVARVAELGNAERGGLKARFGHPNMCSTALGTFLGRWKSFSVVGDRALADLYLSKSAHKTPQGDLAGYVMDMAEKEPDMFGVSIVFSPGRTYKRGGDGSKIVHPYDEETGDLTDNEKRKRRERYRETPGPEYVECAELHAADVVDDPAANPDGLFSRWSQATIAGQVTEFLDTHPEVLDVLIDHPEVVADFQARYMAHMRRKQGSTDMADATAAAAPEAPQTVPPATEAAPAEQLSAPPAPPAAEAAPEPEVAKAPKSIDVAEFAKIKAKFGAEAAAHAVEVGGNYYTACEAAYDAILKERDELRAALAAKAAGGSPAGFVPQDGKKKPEFKDLFSKAKP